MPQNGSSQTGTSGITLIGSLVPHVHTSPPVIPNAVHSKKRLHGQLLPAPRTLTMWLIRSHPWRQNALWWLDITAITLGRVAGQLAWPKVMCPWLCHWPAPVISLAQVQVKTPQIHYSSLPPDKEVTVTQRPPYLPPPAGWSNSHFSATASAGKGGLGLDCD